MLENIFTLLMLIILQSVLGFDNLLYISLESKRVPEGERAQVRNMGIGLAIILRIVLLFVLIRSIPYLKGVFWEVDSSLFEISLSTHNLIYMLGGAFIMYTAVKEVFHMMHIDVSNNEDKAPVSKAKVIGMIVLMNLVFSFDSILSAIALTDVFWVMAVAIVVSGVGMIFLSDGVSRFLEKNRMYEILGLFVLLIVGILLVTEGAHLAHLSFFGKPVHAMSKTTFYFVLAVLVIVDIVQARYQKKLLLQK